MPTPTSPRAVTPQTRVRNRKPSKLNDHATGKSAISQNGNDTDTNQKNNWQILWIAVNSVDPNPFQPRLLFDELEMQELIASVRAKGVQQPVLVRTSKADIAVADKAASNKAVINGNGKGQTSNGFSASPPLRLGAPRYELVAGERRLRACKQAGKRWIPAIVRDDLSDAEAAELALLENVQRSNISVIEEVRGYKRLMLEFRLKEERLSKKVGKSVGTIREMMKLLQLPDPVQSLLWQKKLFAAHGYELLALAPFEKVCVSVAEYAVREKLTATSLGATLLPNAKQLKGLGTLVELDFKSKFDWRSECGKCPFKAYVRSGYSSYCLLPEEWSKKQEAALAREREEQNEAARVLEEARQQTNGVVEVEHLTPGSYKDLSFGEPPAGCSPSCSCYKEAEDAHDPTKKRPVCLDPNRYRSLVQAEREAEENARRLRFNALWESAKEKLSADVEEGDLCRLTVLIALPILRSMYDEHGYVESWRQGVLQIAEELDVLVLDDFLNADSESDAYEALDNAMQEGCRPERVLLLCACLILANEARTAIRYIRETPSLNFIVGVDVQSEFPIDFDSGS